ncbi:MAG: DUF6172 family protein [Spirochaetaceae bacterium]
MKKIFILTHPKKKKDRLFEEAKRDVKKYIKRETSKALPEDFDSWIFDCRFGKTEDEAKTIDRNDITKNIDAAQKEDLDSFYLEILARPWNKPASVFIDRSEESTD